MMQKNALSKQDIYPLSFLLCGITWHGPSLSLTIEEPITTVKAYNSLEKFCLNTYFNLVISSEKDFFSL